MGPRSLFAWGSATGAASAAGLALYWRSTRSGFCLDDHLAIESNFDVVHGTTAALWHDFWGRDMNAENSHKSWRPLTILSFQLNHMAVGLEPAMYHATNAVLHALVSGLVVQLGRVMSDGDLATSTLAGAIFAVHPIHVEAVAGIVGRADVLGTMFSILAFLAYAQLLKSCSVIGPRRWVCVDGILVWSAIFVCLAWAAFLSKEVAVTLLGIVAAYDLACQPWLCGWMPVPTTRGQTRDHDAGRLPLLALALRWSLLFFCGASYLGVRHLLTLDSGRATLEGSGLLRRAENPFALLHGADRLRSMLYLPAYYGWLLLWPQEMCCEYSYNCIPALLSWSDPRNVATVAFFLVLGLIAAGCVQSHNTIWAVIHRHHPVPVATQSDDKLARDRVCLEDGDEESACVQGSFALGGLCWLVLPMLPATNAFFVVGTLIAERLLYMPSVGYSLLLAAAVVRVMHSHGTGNSRDPSGIRSRSLSPQCAAVMVAILAAGFAIAAQRTLSRQADWDDDTSLYKSAVQTCSNSAKNHHQLGQLHENAGKTAAAWDHYTRVMEIDSEFCDVELNLGQMLLRQCQEAVIEGSENGGRLLRPSLPWLFDANKQPRSPMAPRSLGQCPGVGVAISHLRNNVDCVFTNMKSFPLLIQVLQLLIEEQPTNATLYKQLGELMAHAGHEIEGASYYSSQGQAAKQRGDFKGAAKAFAQASELMPSRCEYSFWRGEALHSRWEVKYGSGGAGGINMLSAACSEVMDAIHCVNEIQDENGGRPYAADLGNGQLTAVTAGNFVPTVLQWYQQILALLQPEGQTVSDEQITRRGSVYENMATAVEALQPEEAAAGGIDQNSVISGYLLHAAADNAAVGNLADTSAKLRRIDQFAKATDSDIPPACPLALRFVQVGLLAIHKALEGMQPQINELANQILEWAPRARSCNEIPNAVDSQIKQLEQMVHGGTQNVVRSTVDQ